MLATISRASWVTTTAAALLAVVGVALSHRVEPGIRVDVVTLAGDTPALRFRPTAGGPHPTALLAHGLALSKETLFRYGEALAAAGFVCYAIDLPGHGRSPEAFSSDAVVRTIDTVSRALGVVDIFLGHSMGSYTGSQSADAGYLHPKLFIAVGSSPRFERHDPPLLLLAGRFDEHIPVAALRARSDARLVVSPWSDHFLELYDPILVHAAVDAARTTVGAPEPSTPRQWYWRLLGLGLAVLGGIVVGMQLPELIPTLAPVRGVLLALAAIVALAPAARPWFGMMPVVRRLPWQLLFVGVLALALFGLRRVRWPRWSLLVLAAATVVGCLIVRQPFLALLAAGLLVTLLAGTAIGGIAGSRGTRRDGDLALAIFAGYVLGQWPFWFVLVRHL